MYYFLFVEIPKGIYKGQKLIKLVSIKIPARIKRMIATVPEIKWLKYKTAITIAASILIILSTEPMFFVMLIKI